MNPQNGTSPKDGTSPAPTRVLVVDDEDAIREVLRLRLEAWGYQVALAGDGRQATELTESFDPEIVVSDVVMPELSGLELLRQLQGDQPQRPVILLTAHGTVDMAVEAMKQGAHDFITKPLDYNKLKSTLEAAQRELALRRKSQQIESQLDQPGALGELVGSSRTMLEVYELIQTVSATDAAVLITGESGTGKEIVARTIHQLSARRAGPFIAINASALPENLIESEVFGHEKGAFTGASAVRPGCFELADGGTLLLDEIAEMPVSLQPKLLRVLEDGRVRRLGGKQELSFDVRLLSSTNCDPKSAIQEGQLREDLYYRMNVFHIALPPLRNHSEDIPLLVQHFIHHFARKHTVEVEGLRDESLQILQDYAWPGNVRELRNVIERAVILAKQGWIEPSHLPPYLREPATESTEQLGMPLGTTFAAAEKQLILKTLQATGNNKAETARRLGLDVKTIRNKLKSYGL